MAVEWLHVLVPTCASLCSVSTTHHEAVYGAGVLAWAGLDKPRSDAGDRVVSIGEGREKLCTGNRRSKQDGHQSYKHILHNSKHQRHWYRGMCEQRDAHQVVDTHCEHSPFCCHKKLLILPQGVLAPEVRRMARTESARRELKGRGEGDDPAEQEKDGMLNTLEPTISPVRCLDCDGEWTRETKTNFASLAQQP